MPAEALRLRDFRRTSAFRLTIALGAVFVAAIIVLLGLVYLMTARELIARNDRIMRVEASRLLVTPPEQLPARVAAQVARNAADYLYAALYAQDGERVAGNIGLTRLPPLGRMIEMEGPAGPLRVLAEATPTGETIVIGRDISQIRYLRWRLLMILAGSGTIAVAGVTAAALLLSRAPLRRVHDLELAARRIAEGHLDERMPIAGRHDELDQFAATVNVMVEAVGRTIAQVKGVTDAVAHDLRTPLTRVRATLGRAERDAAGNPALATVAEAAIVDLDLVLARFNALLRIAEIEAGARRSGFATVDLGRLLEGVHGLYEPLAEERGVALELAAIAPIAIEGDEKLLFEAVSNLVDNAIKFARTRVTIALGLEGERSSIAVTDDGPGIPPDEREAVLRRFHRGANAEGIPGTGLGLSVVAAIATLHGHALEFADGPAGFTARLSLG